jgi:hypothetical protein
MKRSRSSSKIQFVQDLFESHRGVVRACAGMPGDDQLVFQRVFPADEFGDRHLVAMRFELQAAQGVGHLAAEFAGVDRMPPEFRQRRPGQGFVLLAAQHGGDFGLAAGDEDDELRLLVQGEADGVVGGRIAGVQRGDDVDRSGRPASRWRSRRAGEEGHAREAEPLASCATFDEFLARLDAVDVAVLAALKKRS